MVTLTRVVSIIKWCISWGSTAWGCTHPLVFIVLHGPICIRIPPQGLQIMPRKAPIIPHGHVCPRVSLH